MWYSSNLRTADAFFLFPNWQNMTTTIKSRYINRKITWMDTTWNTWNPANWNLSSNFVLKTSKDTQPINFKQLCNPFNSKCFCEWGIYYLYEYLSDSISVAKKLFSSIFRHSKVAQAFILDRNEMRFRISQDVFNN